MYQNNPDGITWRVKQVIARALESWSRRDSGAAAATVARGGPGPGRGLPDGSGNRTGAEMRPVFDAYAGGASLGEVMASTGLQPGNGVELPQRTRTRDRRLDRARPAGGDRRARE
jgi:hypothetical protein